MLFNVEIDQGHVIAGYLVLDTFTACGEVVVVRDGQEVARVPTLYVRDEIRLAGRHETGLCGFAITEEEVPGLRHMPDLEILEPESGVMIYRRCPPEAVVQQKILRLETQLLPFAKLDRALQPYFQLYHPTIDRFGQETIFQLFLIGKESNYVSGRVSFKGLEFYIDRGYKTVALIQDPFEELAERILVLRLIADGYNSFLGPRDEVLFEDAIAFAKDLPIENGRELKRAFRDVPQSVAMALGDPLVRQLTTRLPDDAVGASSIGNALTALSSFQVVGLRSHADEFIEAVAEQFSLDPARLPRIEQIQATMALAERLRACTPVEALLENDIVVYDYLKDAFEKPGTAG